MHLIFLTTTRLVDANLQCLILLGYLLGEDSTTTFFIYILKFEIQILNKTINLVHFCETCLHVKAYRVHIIVDLVVRK